MSGRQVVWSDPEVQRLTSRFVLATEEAYYLFPENAQHRAQIANTPMHAFWNRFSAQVDLGAFRSQGTRQGIYVLGPDAEFLGAHHGRARAEDIRRLLSEAGARWEALRRAKGYRASPIPPGPRAIDAVNKNARPGTVQVLQVSSRDLPRSDGTMVGRRYHELPVEYQNHENFHRWAWNQDWFELNDAEVRALAVSSGPVDAAVVRRLGAERFVDNVRGQVSVWTPGEVQAASLTAQTVSRSNGRRTVRYTGEFRAGNGRRSVNLRLTGSAVVNESSGRFVRFELLAMGNRQGQDTFNFRRTDPGPAPIGFAVTLPGQYGEK